MQKSEYNGWFNYETWCANLWLTNDEGGCAWLEEQAQDCVQDAIGADESDIRNAATYALAERLEAYHDEMAEEWLPDQSSLFADFINAGLREVNWHEIARHAVDEIALYSAGWNMPGYMPDNPPAVFLDADDALEYVTEQIESDEDCAHLDCTPLAADKNGEFGVHAGKYFYFVTRI